MNAGIGCSKAARAQPLAKTLYSTVRVPKVSCCSSSSAEKGKPGPAPKQDTSSPPLVNPLRYSRTRVCPQCQGTGKKPCGQCEGTGVNQEDKFGGSVKAGDVCWLCEGVAKTMCGACVDLTDTF